MTRALCQRCGFLPAVTGTLCNHCTLITSRVRELVERGLTIRDAAQALHVRDVTIARVCLCTDTPTVRHEHARCPKHVLDVRRRLLATATEHQPA